MIYRNLNGDSASSLKVGNCQSSSKNIESTVLDIRITVYIYLVPLVVGGS